LLQSSLGLGSTAVLTFRSL